jgi:hypothetical protein
VADEIMYRGVRLVVRRGSEYWVEIYYPPISNFMEPQGPRSADREAALMKARRLVDYLVNRSRISN